MTTIFMMMLSHWNIQCIPLFLHLIHVDDLRLFVNRFSVVLVYTDSEILPDLSRKEKLIHKKDYNKRRNT